MIDFPQTSLLLVNHYVTQLGARSQKKSMSKSTAKNQLKRALSRELYRKLGVASMTDDQWEDIRSFFDNKCAYSGMSPTKDNPLTKEHLVGLNQNEVGTDHPSNVVPVLQSCQIRKKVKVQGTNDSQQDTWQNHVWSKWPTKAERRIEKIKDHQKQFQPVNGLKGKRKIVKNALKEVDSKISEALDKAISKCEQVGSGNGATRRA